MRFTGIPALLVTVALLGGCATSQQVRLAKAPSRAPVATMAQVPQDGNSVEMDRHLVEALRDEGLSIKAPLPAGTRTATDVDALVSYVDVWRWDLKMYMKSLSIRMHDARTGDLLVTGEWRDSAMHGFRDAGEAMRATVAEMVKTLRDAAPGRP